MAAVPEEFERDFEQAYRAHYPLLHRRSRRFFPAEEAEDAVQETFLRAWAHHHGRDPGIPWMLTVLRNLAIDRSRRKSADPVADIELLDRPTEDTPADQVISLEERRALHRAMEGLTDTQRQALKLREWHGLSHKEVAKSLGTTVSGVESLLVRGKRRLRSALEGARGMMLWPAASLWRKLRHLPTQTEGVATAAPATVSAITTTVAQLATAAAVLVAGVASSSGGGGSDGGGTTPIDGGSHPAVTAGIDGSTGSGGGVTQTPTGSEGTSAAAVVGAPAETKTGDSPAGGTGHPAASPTDPSVVDPATDDAALIDTDKTNPPPKDDTDTGDPETSQTPANETGEPPEQPVLVDGTGIQSPDVPTTGT